MADLCGYIPPDETSCDVCDIWQEPNVARVFFRRWSCRAQYYSPIPEQWRASTKADLYFCDLCGRYFFREEPWAFHTKACRTMPPGDEIYRDDEKKAVLFHIRGEDESSSVYCRRMLLFAKLFLENKQTFLDVESFSFFFLYEFDSAGLHFAGFFSRDRTAGQDHNLACITVLPPYQSKGYGQLLIDVSYRAAWLKDGTPERPMTGAGAAAFLRFWNGRIGHASVGEKATTLRRLSKRSGVSVPDCLYALHESGGLRVDKRRKRLLFKPPPAVAKFAATKLDL